MHTTDVIVVGAGLAGLATALELQQAGREVLVIEATDRAGGRVKTDLVDGYRLDRGFQVYLEAYPQGQRYLDLDSLDFSPFMPGALVRSGGKFHVLADPLRAPRHFFKTLLSPIGTLGDRMRMMELQARSCQGPLQSVFDRREITTLERLERIGFSSDMISSFFRPFLGGIFLDKDLETSSRMLDFVFRMISRGRTVVPARGMEEIPHQIAGRLKEGTIRCNCPAARVEGGRVELEGGEILTADSVVLATEGPVAHRLTGGLIPDTGSRPVTCLYFSAERIPSRIGSWLVLNGEGKGPVNNLAIMSEVSPEYAPAGRHLISVTVLDDGTGEGELIRQVRRQLRRWFGGRVEKWEHLRTYHIPHGQPIQRCGFREERMCPAEVAPGLLVAGDYRDTASINGALYSGRKAAESILNPVPLQV